MISNGNFHPMVLAIACDALTDCARPGWAAQRAPDVPSLGRVHAADDRPCRRRRCTGCSCATRPQQLFPELKQLAAPATLDTPPLDLGVEDHHTAAPLSVRKTDVALGLLEDLLAIELMLARDMLATAPTKHVLGAGTDAALRMVEEAITVADPQPDAVHRALRERFPVRRAGASAANGQSAAR